MSTVYAKTASGRFVTISDKCLRQLGKVLEIKRDKTVVDFLRSCRSEAKVPRQSATRVLERLNALYWEDISLNQQSQDFIRKVYDVLKGEIDHNPPPTPPRRKRKKKNPGLSLNEIKRRQQQRKGSAKQETVKVRILFKYYNAERGREKMMEEKALKAMKKHIRYRLRRLGPSASVTSVEQGYDGVEIDLVMYKDFDGNPQKAKSILEEFIGKIVEELAYESEYNEEKYGNLYYFLPVYDGKASHEEIEVDVEYVPEAFGQQRLFATQRRTSMSNLKDRLIRLGYEQPELRDNLRPILDFIKKAYRNGDYGDQSRNEAFYPESGHKEQPAVGMRQASGDPYEQYMEKQRDQAYQDVKKKGRDHWTVQVGSKTVEVSMDRRQMKYHVSFPDGSAVQVQTSGNGMTNITNHTGDTSKGSLASKAVKKVKLARD